jgi:hypothetical protein
MNDHQVATSANGKDVYINLMQPPTSVTISRNPNLLSLIKEIAAKSEFTGKTIDLEYDMKRTVGYADSIETKAEDTVFYARQAKSKTYTRFVKNRKTDATTIVSMHLEETGPKAYTIKNVWIGPIPVPLPGAENTSPKSEEYWQDHAVVYNGQPLMASTVTKDCPY